VEAALLARAGTTGLRHCHRRLLLLLLLLLLLPLLLLLLLLQLATGADGPEAGHVADDGRGVVARGCGHAEVQQEMGGRLFADHRRRG